MICKKCGAYNPDHATYCKVCAASLKDQDGAEEAVQTEEVEEAAEEKVRPRRGNVKAPDFAAMRRDSFKVAPKAEEPADDEDEDEEEDELDEEEEVKPARKSLFSRPAAPAKKRRVVDEDDEEENEDEEDEYDEEERDDAEKLESEPKTTRFARALGKKRPAEEKEEDEDEEEDEGEDDDGDDYDDDGYEEDDEDYEEYEPTPPRRKKSSRSQGSSSGPSIVTLLIVCLLAILLIIVGIVAFCNIKGGSTKAKLPGFLQFNCAGKATTEKAPDPQQQAVVPPASDPTEAPVTGTPVDYSKTELEEFTDSEGRDCISISMTSRPGDTVTIVLPNQDDYVIENKESTDVPYLLTIFKSCYYPKKALEESVYTVTPQILVKHADGTEESLHVDSFDLTFPTVSLELIEPAQATIPEEGIMAAEGNELLIKGKVDDHTVVVTINGQRVANMYTDGYFDYTYSLSGEEAETVDIQAAKDDYVSTSYSFTVNPYVFIPEKMVLEVESDISKLKADKNNKVTVTGTTVPGTTLTATPAAEYQSSVVCGSPVVDAEGHYTFDVTFAKDYYGVASITIHAKKDGYEEGDASCTVSRMYADRAKAVTGFNKTKSYHEVPNYSFEKVMENPTAAGLYRIQGSATAIDAETGIITFAAKTNAKNAKETTNIYVVNASTWKPKLNANVKIYCTLNGLYTDGTSLYVTAWFYI